MFAFFESFESCDSYICALCWIDWLAQRFLANNSDEFFDGCNHFLSHVTHRGRQAKIRIRTANIPKHKFEKGHCLDRTVALRQRTEQWVIYRLWAAILDGVSRRGTSICYINTLSIVI
jgi:hypothetical protein